MLELKSFEKLAQLEVGICRQILQYSEQMPLHSAALCPGTQTPNLALWPYSSLSSPVHFAPIYYCKWHKNCWTLRKHFLMAGTPTSCLAEATSRGWSRRTSGGLISRHGGGCLRNPTSHFQSRSPMFEHLQTPSGKQEQETSPKPLVSNHTKSAFCRCHQSWVTFITFLTLPEELHLISWLFIFFKDQLNIKGIYQGLRCSESNSTDASACGFCGEQQVEAWSCSASLAGTQGDSGGDTAPFSAPGLCTESWKSPAPILRMHPHPGSKGLCHVSISSSTLLWKPEITVAGLGICQLTVFSAVNTSLLKFKAAQKKDQL